MVQLPQENSIFARTVRRAAGEDRLSHAVILTGRGDLPGFSPPPTSARGRTGPACAAATAARYWRASTRT